MFSSPTALLSDNLQCPTLVRMWLCLFYHECAKDLSRAKRSNLFMYCITQRILISQTRFPSQVQLLSCCHCDCVVIEPGKKSNLFCMYASRNLHLTCVSRHMFDFECFCCLSFECARDLTRSIGTIFFVLHHPILISYGRSYVRFSCQMNFVCYSVCAVIEPGKKVQSSYVRIMYSSSHMCFAPRV